MSFLLSTHENILWGFGLNIPQHFLSIFEPPRRLRSVLFPLDFNTFKMTHSQVAVC